MKQPQQNRNGTEWPHQFSKGPKSLFQHTDHTPKSSAPSWSFFHFKQASFVLKQAPKAEKKSTGLWYLAHEKDKSVEFQIWKTKTYQYRILSSPKG